MHKIDQSRITLKQPYIVHNLLVISLRTSKLFHAFILAVRKQSWYFDTLISHKNKQTEIQKSQYLNRTCHLTSTNFTREAHLHYHNSMLFHKYTNSRLKWRFIIMMYLKDVGLSFTQTFEDNNISNCNNMYNKLLTVIENMFCNL